MIVASLPSVSAKDGWKARAMGDSGNREGLMVLAFQLQILMGGTDIFIRSAGRRGGLVGWQAGDLRGGLLIMRGGLGVVETSEFVDVTLRRAVCRVEADARR